MVLSPFRLEFSVSSSVLGHIHACSTTKSSRVGNLFYLPLPDSFLVKEEAEHVDVERCVALQIAIAIICAADMATLEASFPRHV